MLYKTIKQPNLEGITNAISEFVALHAVAIKTMWIGSVSCQMYTIILGYTTDGPYYPISIEFVDVPTQGYWMSVLNEEDLKNTINEAALKIVEVIPTAEILTYSLFDCWNEIRYENNLCIAFLLKR
jgi:hypothetical protein